MTNTATETFTAPINVTCTALVHIPAAPTAPPAEPIYKRCVINDRPRFGGRILTVRFYNAAPIEIYVSDIVDVSDRHMLAIGRTAGKEGLAGLHALGIADTDPAYPLVLRCAQTLINLL